ncbi:hypothetical protein DV736_g2314, partial [Chaetothyriales sp. CBS 134916]
MLVDYSDSESDEQQPASERATSNHSLTHGEGNRLEKNPCGPRSVRSLALPLASSPPLPLPPLPASFHALYATNVRGAVSDDPSLHGGRARQVAHVEGNWPTHIFLEWIPAVDELWQLEHVLLRACRGHEAESRNSAVHSLLRSELNVPQPLHISLSAPLTLKTEQKDAVAAAVDAGVSKSGAQAFAVSPTRLCWVSNSERSRSFLVLKLTRPENDDLNRLLKACNASVGSFGLKTLYYCCSSSSQRAPSTTAPEFDAVSDNTSDGFHISIAWTLGDVGNLPVPGITRGCNTNSCHVRDDDGDEDDITSMQIGFDTVKLKIGNVVKNILLRPSLSIGTYDHHSIDMA